jgi:AcrR family transcriptional regulator
VLYVWRLGIIDGDVNHTPNPVAGAVAPPTRTPRAAWIEAGLGALAAGGPDAVRIEPLAKSLGVTRGSFYGHFEDRGALLEAMLDTWEQAATHDVLERVEHRGGDPREKITHAGVLTFSETLLPIELAIRDWSRRQPDVAERLRRVDNQRMEYLRSLFQAFCVDEREIEARSVLAFSLAIGHHFMAADHDPRSRAEALELAVNQLLR